MLLLPLLEPHFGPKELGKSAGDTSKPRSFHIAFEIEQESSSLYGKCSCNSQARDLHHHSVHRVEVGLITRMAHLAACQLRGIDLVGDLPGILSITRSTKDMRGSIVRGAT